MDTSQRLRLVNKAERGISVKRQAEMLNVNRSSIYKAESISSMISDAELELRGQVDRLHTDHPTWGYRMISDALRLVGKWINRKKVRRIMRDMSIYAIYPKPNLSKRYHAAHIRPYLLRKLAITEPDQVWGVDITYVHFPKGFMYLFVIIDWYSRCIVDYELSGTLDKRFVMECLRRAMSDRKPQIINSDQGSHFTNPNYLRLMEEHGVRISMDGKGQCRDNARTERFFRTLKYDTVYIQEVDSPRDLRAMFDKYIPEYNTNRPHSSLGGRTPAEVYFGDSKEYVA